MSPAGWADGRPSVTVAVLNFNGRLHVEPCFTSLAALDYPPELLELMLVDNASTDDSVAVVEARFPAVRVVRSERNLGFGGGNNLAARESRADYVVFLNNDMVVEPGFVGGLVDAVESSPKIACAGARILDWEGATFDFAGGVLSFSGHGGQLAFGEPVSADAYTEIAPTPFACGGAMIVDRSIFLDVGSFDDDFLFFFEDVDLGWRLWLLGYEVVRAPAAVVRHRHHGSVGSISLYRRLALYRRNSLAATIKNYSDENMGTMLAAALLVAGAGLEERAAAVFGLDRSVFGVFDRRPIDDAPLLLEKDAASLLVALRDLVDWLPSLMEKRRIVQGRRVRSDEDLAHLFRPFALPQPTATAYTRHAVGAAFGVHDLFKAAPRRVLVCADERGPRVDALGAALRARGHEVLISTRDAMERLRWEPGHLHRVVDIVQPDVLVVSGADVLRHVALDPFERVPLVVDASGASGALAAADFVTADARELADLHGWLERAGWTEGERLTRSAVAVPPDVDMLDRFVRRATIRRATEPAPPASLRLLGTGRWRGRWIKVQRAYRLGGARRVAQRGAAVLRARLPLR